MNNILLKIKFLIILFIFITNCSVEDDSIQNESLVVSSDSTTDDSTTNDSTTDDSTTDDSTTDDSTTDNSTQQSNYNSNNSYLFKVQFGGRTEGTSNIVNVEQIMNGFKSSETNFTFEGNKIFFNFLSENTPNTSVVTYWYGGNDTYRLFQDGVYNYETGYLNSDLNNIQNDTFVLKLDDGYGHFSDSSNRPVVYKLVYVIINF